MPINEQIKINRKKAGLTQEQVVNYLGVSTPAVNKWERGNTFPDAALLPALARLLKIDLNTLFSFHEELTAPEVKEFTVQLVETAQTGGIESAFDMAAEKIRQFPHCDNLLYSSAAVLDSSLILSALSTKQKEKQEQQILLWYELAAKSQDEAVRNAAVYMLAGKYLKQSNFEKAGQLIGQIPEQHADKTFFQIEIFTHQGKLTEAAALLEGKLVQDLGKIQTCLFKLIELELKDANMEEAEQIAEIAQAMVPLFGLWHYGAVTPRLQIALYQKDADQSIQWIKKILDAARTPWKLIDSPLFYRIARPSMEHLTEQIGTCFIPSFISELERSDEYDFLRDNKEFKELLDLCKAELPPSV